MYQYNCFVKLYYKSEAPSPSWFNGMSWQIWLTKSFQCLDRLDRVNIKAGTQQFSIVVDLEDCLDAALLW